MPRIACLLLLVPIAFLAAAEPKADDIVLTDEARAIHREALLIDGHNDLPYALREKDGPVVGVHMVGARVGELVGEGQLVVNWEAYPEDVAALVHAHPTQNEAFGEAFLALAGKPLHAHS